MKLSLLLLISVVCIAFCPTTDKAVKTYSNGFYIVVEDFTNRSHQQFLVESKDSVNTIFKQFFNSELELGTVNNPISIYNGKHSFYIARVNIFENPNGEKQFKHLKYSKIFQKRSRLNPATF